MTASSRRATYRHGNLKSAALKAATRLVAKVGHEQLSLREVADAVGVAHRSLYNHFRDREALLDAVATEAYNRLAAILVKTNTPEDYTAKYVRFALANRALYALMTSRPHATMKYNPPLQTAVHGVITQAMRIFCRDIPTPAARRRDENLHHALWRHFALCGRRARPTQRKGADCGTIGDECREMNAGM
jgi:AcrR family transcriptional regulator